MNIKEFVEVCAGVTKYIGYKSAVIMNFQK